MSRVLGALVALAVSAGFASAAFGDEAAIRKAIAERVPRFPKIDEIRATAIPGLYEVRTGSEIIYTDERGDYIIEGQLIETRSRRNLTEDRVSLLTAIDFKTLPLQDAVVWKQGNGDRKLVVFADPNCGFCKKLERETLQAMQDVTVYTFLYPILGSDSAEKSKAIWCAKDSTKAWKDWMLSGALPTDSEDCDTSVLQRNAALGNRYRIKGTPGLVFEDGRQVPGALGTQELEKRFVMARAKGPA